MDQKWLETCLTAGEFLYGEFPVAVLQKLFATKGEQISKAEVMEFYDESYMMLCDGEMFSPLIATEEPMLSMFREADKNGNPYASLHYDLDELKELRRGHEIVADQDYWMPTSSQIEELVERGYISSSGMEKLEEGIRKRGGDPGYLKLLWPKISTGKLEMLEAISEVINGMYPRAVGMEEGAEVPEEMMASIPSIDDLNAMMPMVNTFLNSVNNRNRKGWPPAEGCVFPRSERQGGRAVPHEEQRKAGTEVWRFHKSG